MPLSRIDQLTTASLKHAKLDRGNSYAKATGSFAKCQPRESRESRESAASEGAEGEFVNTMRQLKVHYTDATLASGRDEGEGLDFVEFAAMVRERIHIGPDRANDAQLRRWFEGCDRNGNGRIEATEFFTFSLKCAQQAAGGERDFRGVAELLRTTFDTTNDGKFDQKEFRKMARRFGFGDHADELFEHIDATHDGSISIQEMLDAAHGSRMGMGTGSSSTGAFVAALSINAALMREEARVAGSALVDQGQALDSEAAGQLISMLGLDLVPPGKSSSSSREPPQRPTTLSGEALTQAVEALRMSLVSELTKRGLGASALFAGVDKDGDSRVNRSEFAAALIRWLKLPQLPELPREVVDAIFDELDKDLEGGISYVEFAQWLRVSDFASGAAAAPATPSNAVGTPESSAEQSGPRPPPRPPQLDLAAATNEYPGRGVSREHGGRAITGRGGAPGAGRVASARAAPRLERNPSPTPLTPRWLRKPPTPTVNRRGVHGLSSAEKRLYSWPAPPPRTEAQRRHHAEAMSRLGLLERFEPHVAPRSARSGNIVPVIYLTTTDPGDRHSKLATARARGHVRSAPPFPSSARAGADAGKAPSPPEHRPPPGLSQGPRPTHQLLATRLQEQEQMQQQQQEEEQQQQHAKSARAHNSYGPVYKWSDAAIDYMWQGAFVAPRHRASPKAKRAAIRFSKGSPENRMFADLFVRGTIRAAC